MRIRVLLAVASSTTMLALAAPAFAGITPYVRVDYGGSQMRLPEANKLLKENEATVYQAGLSPEFKSIGGGYGPSVTAGLWVIPGFRVGGFYSYARSVVENHLNEQGVVYAHDLDFRLTEVGGEAAAHFASLGGLTVGATLGRGRAVMIEGLSRDDVNGKYREASTAIVVKNTYGAFVGFDQTNIAGVAGSIRVGYRFSDMGSMPSLGEITDASGTTRTWGNSIPLDYSGAYVRFGIGFDLRH